MLIPSDGHVRTKWWLEVFFNDSHIGVHSINYRELPHLKSWMPSNNCRWIAETGLQLLQRDSLTSVSCIKGPKRKLQRGSSKKPCNLSLKQSITLAEDVASFSSSIGVFVYSPIKMYMYNHEDVLKEYGRIYLRSYVQNASIYIYIHTYLYVHIITIYYDMCVYNHIDIYTYRIKCFASMDFFFEPWKPSMAFVFLQFKLGRALVL